jgi:hypothetical protein
MAHAPEQTMALGEALAVLGTDYTNLSAFRSVVIFCQEQWAIPAVACAAYLAMVYATRKTIAKHRHLALADKCFALWNLGLSLFSCWGFWHMARAMLPMAASDGLQFSICSPTSDLVLRFKEAPTALALCLFCFSKIPELGDTVFLVVKCKKVRFLQWYHHTTVLLFCWLALATEYTPGLWFAVTNYFVHSIMYAYFFLMTYPSAARLVEPVAPVITVIQITQMLWGLVVNAIAIGTYFSSGACQIQGITVYSAILMYASYFYLFSQLFFEARGSGKKDRRALARAVSRKISEALLNSGSKEEEHEDGHLKAN